MLLKANTFTTRRNAACFKVVHSHMFAKRHQLQVLKSVVGLIAVSMMNYFIWLQGTAQVICHYKPMLQDHTIRAGVRVIGVVNQYIALCRKLATSLPTGIVRLKSRREVSPIAGQWVTSKNTTSFRGVFRYRRGCSATTFTNAVRDFVKAGCVNIHTPILTETGV